jgi:hypothetical protein
MPIIVPPSSDTQAKDALRVLEELAPPCEYSVHDKYGSGPAVWAVWLARTCCAPALCALFCDQCWAARNSRGIVQCQMCGECYGPFEGILRVERI